jgi:hypothetical protein
MVPYYQDDCCTIYNANCEDVLPSLGRFNLLLTEAPQYPPGLSDHNKARMDAGLKVAGQSTLAGSLPEAGLQLAIQSCDNAIVWHPDRFKLPNGKKLDWTCHKQQIATAWHNIVAPKAMMWGPLTETERQRLFIQCIDFTPQANTILDPFMATGDILIAALRRQRKFVGIEIDQQRCEQAVKRIPERKKT